MSNSRKGETYYCIQYVCYFKVRSTDQAVSIDSTTSDTTSCVIETLIRLRSNWKLIVEALFHTDDLCMCQTSVSVSTFQAYKSCLLSAQLKGTIRIAAGTIRVYLILKYVSTFKTRKLPFSALHFFSRDCLRNSSIRFGKVLQRKLGYSGSFVYRFFSVHWRRVDWLRF
jgi:hypothetical protein